MIRKFTAWVLITIFSFEAIAADPCTRCGQQEPQVLAQIEQQRKICESATAANPMFDFEKDPNVIQIQLMGMARCFQGVGDTLFEARKGLGSVFKMVPEALAFLYVNPDKALNMARNAYQFTPPALALRASGEMGKGICKWVSKQYSNPSTDPVACSMMASVSGGEDTQALFQKAQVVATMLGEFLKDVSTHIKTWWSDFLCLPPTLQEKMLCSLVTKAFLLYMGPKEIEWGIKLGAAGIRAAIRGTEFFKNAMTSSSRLLKAVKEAQAIEGTSFSEAAERTAQMLRTAAEATKSQVTKFRFKGGDLVERQTALGPQLFYSAKKIRVVAGKTVTETQDIAIGYDAATHSIDARNPLGRKFLTDVLQGSQRGDTVFVKMDPVALRQSNYTPPVKLTDGTIVQGDAVGDFYLKRITKIIEENTRSVQGQDLVSRWGGDEIALVLRDAQPKDSMAVLERINKAVHADPDLNAIFAANSGMKGLKPAVSIGATVVQNGDTSLTAFQRADNALRPMKKDYYEAFGLDATKYLGKEALPQPIAHPHPPRISDIH